MRASLFTYSLLTLVFTYSGKAQTYDPIGLIDQAPYSVTGKQVFDGGSLWGYMNGGADLYLEYGFNRLYYCDLSYQDLKFKIECFEMTEPLAAWGIYSVNRRKCLSQDTIHPGDCLNNFQYQAVKGHIYFNVIALQNNDRSKSVMLKLAQQLLNGTSEQLLPIPEPLSDTQSPGQLSDYQILRGTIAVDNHLFDFSELMHGIRGFTIWAQTAHESGQPAIFLITAEENEIKRILDRLGIQQPKPGPVELNRDNRLWTIEIMPASLLITSTDIE